MYLCGNVVQETIYAVMFLPEEEALIESYGRLTGKTVSEIIRTFTMERIEDEMNTNIIRETLAEHRSNPRTFSFDEELERLGLE